MKLIIFFTLGLLSACNPFKESTKEAFSLESIKSVLISIDGKSDSFIMKNGTLLHEHHHYQLSKSKTDSWLKSLAEIDSLKSGNPGGPIVRETPDAIEISFQDGPRYLYQGSRGANSYYAIVQKFPADNDSVSGIFFLKKENYETLFKRTNQLRIDGLSVDGVEKIQYEFNGNIYNLDDSQMRIVCDHLKTVKITNYIHSGLVTDEIKMDHQIGQRINGNLPGELILKTKTGSTRISFAKPIAHNPVTTIYVQGRNEIYSASVENWQALEMLFGKLVLRK